MNKLIDKFFELVRSGDVEIYNEFSFQHEFGFFLREYMPDKKVQFERNVSYFFDKAFFGKKEIDISIFGESSLDYAVELKCPRNGQVPETMYSFCRDIAFLEQLRESGFNQTYFIAIADDPLFYAGNPKGIYGLFRNGQPITGKINKPTGAKDTSVSITGSYSACWQKIRGNTKYCVIQTQRTNNTKRRS